MRKRCQNIPAEPQFPRPEPRGRFAALRAKNKLSASNRLLAHGTAKLAQTVERAIRKTNPVYQDTDLGPSRAASSSALSRDAARQNDRANGGARPCAAPA